MTAPGRGWCGVCPDLCGKTLIPKTMLPNGSYIEVTVELSYIGVTSRDP